MEVQKLINKLVELGKKWLQLNEEWYGWCTNEIGTITENIYVRLYYSKDKDHIAITIGQEYKEGLQINYHDIPTISINYNNLNIEHLTELYNKYNNYLTELENKIPKQLEIKFE